MSEPTWIVAILAFAAVLIASFKYRVTRDYMCRRATLDGNLQHVREASGPDPAIVLDMVLQGPYYVRLRPPDDPGEYPSRVTD